MEQVPSWILLFTQRSKRWSYNQNRIYKNNNNDNETVNKERERNIRKHPIPTEKEIILIIIMKLLALFKWCTKATGGFYGEQVKALTEKFYPIITDLIGR